MSPRQNRPRGYTVAVPGEPDRDFATYSEALGYGESFLPVAGGYEVFDRRTRQRVKSVTMAPAPYLSTGWDSILRRQET